MLDRDIFNKGMGLLMASFPEYQCTPETVEAYWTFLKDFNPDDFKKVITSHIKQNKWFPKISELNEELVRLKGFHRPTAAQSWETLIKEAEAGTEDYQGDEATMRALAAVGGWRTFSFTPFKDLAFRFRDFERTYNDAIAKADQQLKLGGAPERPQIGEQKKLEVLK